MATETPTSSITPLYAPLDPTLTQFRLIRVLPGLHDGMIECELRAASHQTTSLEYKALSYQWGEDEPSHQIRLDGHIFNVRRNLYSFLSQMAGQGSEELRLVRRRLAELESGMERGASEVPKELERLEAMLASVSCEYDSNETDDSWFFVDALCINQNDPKEKASQVKFMREIYSQAKEVVIWMSFDPGEERLRSREDIIWNNSFWSRLWVVQEVLLAKDLTIRTGGRTMSWRFLVASDRAIAPQAGKTSNVNFAPYGVYAPEKGIVAKQILSWKVRQAESAQMSFHKAVDFFATQSCSVQHDKIYGLMGITTSRIEVDYSMQIMDLFIATLADYFNSISLPADKVSWFRTILRGQSVGATISAERTFVAPFVAFGLDPFHPVVYLVLHEIAEFFAPGYSADLCRVITYWWWMNRYTSTELIERMLGPTLATLENDVGPMEALRDMILKIDDMIKQDTPYTGIAKATAIPIVKDIAIPLAKEYAEGLYQGAKYTWKDTKLHTAQHKSASEYLKALAQDDSEITAPDSVQTRRYSEWVTAARTTCETLQQRCQAEGHWSPTIKAEDGREEVDNGEGWHLNDDELFSDDEGWALVD